MLEFGSIVPNAKFLSNFLWNELHEKLTTFIILPLGENVQISIGLLKLVGISSYNDH